MKSSLPVFVLVLLCGRLLAQESRAVVVTDVRFTGFNDVPEAVQAELVGQFAGKTFRGSGWVDELEERTRIACQENGYFKANVEAKLEPLLQDMSRQQVAVNVSVEEGLQYRLKDIQVIGTKVFPPDQLRTLFPLQPGEIFNPAKIWEGLAASLRLYDEKGYIDFSPTPELRFDDDAQGIEVLITVDEGPQYRTGRLLVVGPNSNVNERLMHDWESEIGRPFDWDDFLRNHQSLLSSYSDLANRGSIEKDHENNVVNTTLDLNP